MIECGFPTIIVGYMENSATGKYLMYNPTTKPVILTCNIKWHRFDGANAENDPTLFNLLKAQYRKQSLGIMQETINKTIIH